LAVNTTRPALRPLIVTEVADEPLAIVAVLALGLAVVESSETTVIIRGAPTGGAVTVSGTTMLPPLPTEGESKPQRICFGGAASTETKVESLNPSTESTAYVTPRTKPVTTPDPF